MTNTEIKKSLYKQKPIAAFRCIRSGVAHYYTDLIEQRINFEVPVDDMGTAEFGPTMEAKLLNRWIVNGDD